MKEIHKSISRSVIDLVGSLLVQDLEMPRGAKARVRILLTFGAFEPLSSQDFLNDNTAFVYRVILVYE